MLVKYVDAMSDWLERYHDHLRPPPAAVLEAANKLNEKKNGHARPLELRENGLANVKKDEEPPQFQEPPPFVVDFFTEMKDQFDAVKGKPDAVALHSAILMQEALLLFTVLTLRFKGPSVVKVNKLGTVIFFFFFFE
jgi:N-terminal acetyltransferase B complex non-catalytic subunit